MNTPTIIQSAIFIFGAILGSFVNVVILRVPEKKSIVTPPSACPGCGAELVWFDNIPIISFIILRGRCRSCGAAISLQYPLIEAVCGLIALAMLHRFGLSILFAGYLVFTLALVAVVFIDMRYQIIPDSISLPGIVCGFILSLAPGGIGWQTSLIGLLIGGGSLYAIALGYYLITRREGMGGGDIKLLAMIGAFLGWQSLPFVIFASAAGGAIFGIGAMIQQGKGGKTVIPYGPFMSLAAVAFLFFAPLILTLEIQLFMPPGAMP